MNLNVIIVSNDLDDLLNDHASNTLDAPDDPTSGGCYASIMNASPSDDMPVSDCASNTNVESDPSQDASDQIIDPTDLPPSDIQPVIVEGLFLVCLICLSILNTGSQNLQVCFPE